MARRCLRLTLASVWLLGFGILHAQTPAQPKPKPVQTRPATPAKRPAPAPAPAAPAPVPDRPAPATDVKVVTTYTQGAQVFQNTTYMKGVRQRVEFPGMVSLQQPDLQRSVMLNPAAKRYRVQSYAKTGDKPAVGTTGEGQAPQAAAHGGVVVFTTTLTDTLDRQKMFDMEARHIKTVIAKQTDA